MAKWWDFLACPQCHQSLAVGEIGWSCEDCHQSYPLRDGIPRFLNAEDQARIMASPDGDAMVQGYRAPSAFLTSLRRIISSEYFPGKAWRAARESVLNNDGTRLIIGSGVSRYADAIHLDIDDFPGVNLVADAHYLPLVDNSVDAVICETVLEHVPNPELVISETFRVLKPGGKVFFIVPFLFPFHGHPNDYQRWSQEGLHAAFSAFSHVEVGIHGGPCSSMVNLISEWFYVLSGCRFPRFYTPIKGAVTALLFPIKFLDKWANGFPEAHRLASTLYVHASKS